MTSAQADLVRWLYCIAGFSRARLAADFETTIAEIDAIVSSGLGEVLNRGETQETQTRRGIYVLNARLPVQQVNLSNFELYRRVLRAGLNGN